MRKSIIVYPENSSKAERQINSVLNEGTKLKPSFHVWIPGLTHASCDSAYLDLSLAVARCNYIAENCILGVLY